MNENLYALIKQRFPADHQQTLIETPDGTYYSYADLDRETARYAQLMIEAGLAAGDRVLVQVDKSPQVLFLYLGCLRAGLIYLPLNTAYRRDELDYFLHDAEPKMVIGSPAALEILGELASKHNIRHVYSLTDAGTGSLLDALPGTTDFAAAQCDKDTTAAILYTSGTTGRPKGAMLSHGNLSANSLALQQAWGWQADDVLLHALPLFHTHGLFVACHCVLFGAGKMIFLPKFDPEIILQQLPRSTVFMGVPTYYTRLLNKPQFGVEQCHNMRLFISGSAPLLEQTFHEFKQRTGHTILERYGMTESGMNTSNPLEGERIAGTVGTPLPGVSARIVDEQDNLIADGEVGQLLIKGDNVFTGYWRLAEKTASEFTSDGYFRTGDLATITPAGYIAIVGRGKDLIISGGLNIYPKEVERFIDAVDGVVESAVIGLPDEDFGEAVHAVVVRHPQRDDLTESALIDNLKEKLASFKVPKRIFWVDELPRNAMGKVQKNLLRDRYTENSNC